MESINGILVIIIRMDVANLRIYTFIYDIADFIESVNVHILNWLAMIIQKVTTFGFYSSLREL
jgi:hypothetical protein